MPRINQNLDVVAGVAGGTTSINKVPYLSPSGGGRWFTDLVVICRVDEAPGSKVSWLVYLDKQGNVTEVETERKGANFLSAGAGVYNASLDGLFRSNVGPTDPYMGVGDTGFDGWSLVKERYHDDLPGMRILLRDPAGTIVQGFPTTGTVDFCIRNKDEFAWKEMDNTWRDPTILDLNYPAHNLRRWQNYVLYNDINGRLIFHHLNDKTRGYILATGDQSYWPDFIIRDGIIHYTYSTNLAEDPHAVVIAQLPLSTPMVPFEEPLPEPDIEPYERQLPHFAYYTVGKYGDYFEENLHAQWCVTTEDVAKANEQGAWVIANPGVIRKAMHPAMVMIANDYQGAPPLSEQFPVAEALARELKCGLLAVDEHDWVEMPDNVPVGTFLGFKVFRDPGQTQDEWMQHATECTVRAQNAGCRACWILGCDDRLQTLTERIIIDTLDVASDLFAELGQVGIVGVFSYGRHGTMSDGTPTGGGIVHKTAWRWCKASAAASDDVVWEEYRLPDVEPEPEPEEPKMLYFMDKKPTGSGENVGGLKTWGVKEPQSQPHGTRTTILGFAVKKPNGKYATLNPQGQWEERDGVFGHWEVYEELKPAGVVARRNDNGVEKTYYLEAYELVGYGG